MSFREEARQRAAAVWGAAPFERVAHLLAPLHDLLVARLAPRPGERWLDVASGTGAVAVRAARAGAQVTGVDIAPRLVEAARRIAADEGLDVRYDVGDAEELPYADATFDVVSSSVGAIFAPDHRAVARELARVCRPNGRLGLVAWAPNPEWEAMTAEYRPPPLPEAGDASDWGREEYVRERLGGSFELELELGTHYWEEVSGQASWDLAVQACGPIKTMAEALERSRRHEFERRWVEYQERFRLNGGVRVPAPYLLAIGRRR